MSEWLLRLFGSWGTKQMPESSVNVPEYDDQVIASLVSMIERGDITVCKLERQGISDMEFRWNGHRLYITWYGDGLGGGRLRSISFDGQPSPSTMRGNEMIIGAALKQAESEFRARASRIFDAAGCSVGSQH